MAYKGKIKISSLVFTPYSGQTCSKIRFPTMLFVQDLLECNLLYKRVIMNHDFIHLHIKIPRLNNSLSWRAESWILLWNKRASVRSETVRPITNNIPPCQTIGNTTTSSYSAPETAARSKPALSCFVCRFSKRLNRSIGVALAHETQAQAISMRVRSTPTLLLFSYSVV